MAKRYIISVLIEGKDRLSSVMDSITKGAMERIGHKVTELIQQLPQMAIEMVELGASAEAARYRFTRFAGSASEAEALLDAFQRGADGVTSEMDAMSSAARLLQMDLVDDAAEMELVAAMATKLGDQTMDAGSRISDFAMMLANQSIPRLDNFGISSGRVRERIKELQDQFEDMTREQAFQSAVMEEGQEALDTLGDTSTMTATEIDKLKARIRGVEDSSDVTNSLQQ